MIKRFFKYLMDRKNRNELFKKEFLKSLVVIAEFKASGLLYISEYITPAALTCAVS